MKEQLKTNPARFISQQIKKFVHTSLDNRLVFLNDHIVFDEPLVKFANADDPIFTEYKNIIAPVHLTPKEALAKAYNESLENMPRRISVISWILPITEETRKSNRAETRVPSRLWSHTRWYGELFNDKLRSWVVELLIDSGYRAVAPMLQPYFKVYDDEKGLYSNWSERHIAYAAGNGTFSLSGGFITENGIAHRCGSVVTSLALPESKRTAKSPYSNCLFYRGIDCQSCIKRCPAGAITEKSHDKNKCQQYMLGIGYSPMQIQKHKYNNERTTVGCGLCQTKVPCEYQNPTRKLKRTTKYREIRAV